MDIYIVRHTTPKIEKGICYGQSDLALIDSYLDEFNVILDTIPKGDYHIISSPLQRCSAFAKAYTSPITYDDRLLELDFGDWELMPWKTTRVYSFFEELIQSEFTQPVIIVTHAGPIRALLAKLLEIPLEKSFRIKVQYGDVIHLKKEDNDIKVITDIPVS